MAKQITITLDDDTYERLSYVVGRNAALEMENAGWRRPKPGARRKRRPANSVEEQAVRYIKHGLGDQGPRSGFHCD